jgi:gluconolactonase
VAEVEALAWGYGLLEGPRVDAEGALYFADVTKGGVFRRAPDGATETVVPKRRGVGGIALHAAGGLVISGRDVCHVRDGATRVLFERPEGVGGFNDLTTDASGRVYVGSLRSNPFEMGREQPPGELYRIDLAGRVEELYGDVGLTNGLGFSPDGKRLYHSDTAARAVLVHDVAGDALANRRVFARCAEGPDGLAVDEAGGVWVALYGGGRVQRFTPEGEPDLAIHPPARTVTSVCFGGSDRRDLYVVSADNTDDSARGGTIFRTRVDVPGLPVVSARV